MASYVRRRRCRDKWMSLFPLTQCHFNMLAKELLRETDEQG